MKRTLLTQFRWKPLAATLFLLFIGISASEYQDEAARLLDRWLAEELPDAADQDVFRVDRVVDGDTFVLSTGERVRLIGVDTPESVKPGSPVECFGREASEHLKQLILGQSVRLERDVSDRDRYGRLLRYAYLGDELINERLVRSGYAQTASYPPDIREQERLRAAERLAREEELGLWNPALCPSR